MKTSTPLYINPIFDNVVFIGPDMRAKGGIASVLSTYHQYFKPFHFLPTNSDKGKIAGYANVLFTFCRLPFAKSNIIYDEWESNFENKHGDLAFQLIYYRNCP